MGVKLNGKVESFNEVKVLTKELRFYKGKGL